MTFMSTDELQHELHAVTSHSDARAMVNRAARIAGVPTNRPLDASALLLMCDALAAEGGSIQQLAETIAMRALRD